MLLPEIRQKKINTNLERYGVEYPLQSEKIHNKTSKTYFEKTGFINPLGDPVIQERVKNSNLDKYGVKYPMQNKEVKEKQMVSLYRNGTSISSKGQNYIWSILGGELNFLHYTSFLDVAFLDEKIYLEYDGGGHDLQVKIGNVTEQEFINKERKRWYALYNKGWKEIRIVSTKDKLPDEDKIKEIYKYAKEYLNTGHSWIRFDIDNGIVKTSQFEEEFDFGRLKYNRNIYISKELEDSSFLFCKGGK